MSNRIYNPFNFSKNCPPPVQKKAKNTKISLIVIGVIGIVLVASMSVFLYYGMESTLYFKVNEYDTEGNPIGQTLLTSEYPNAFNISDNYGNPYTIVPENITKAYIGTVGFFFIEQNLLERLILDDKNFTLFFLAMQLKVSTFSTIVSDEVIENFDSIIPYHDYLYNNSFVYVMGNMINNKNNDLIWKFQANSYCIPFFTIKIEYKNPDNSTNDLKTEMNGLCTRILTTRSIADCQVGRGIFEIRISNIKYNYTSIQAYNTNDLPTILTLTRPMCYFESVWASRNWFYDGISVFKPVDQQKI